MKPQERAPKLSSINRRLVLLMPLLAVSSRLGGGESSLSQATALPQANTLQSDKLTLIVVSAPDCPGRRQWKAASGNSLEAIVTSSKINFVEIQSPSVTIGGDLDGLWPAELRWVRPAAQAGYVPGYAPWFGLVQDTRFVAVGTAMAGWRSQILPVLDQVSLST
jgi:hypothetical protein